MMIDERNVTKCVSIVMIEGEGQIREAAREMKGVHRL